VAVLDWSWVSHACRSLASCWKGSVVPVAAPAASVLAAVVLVLVVDVALLPVLTAVRPGVGVVSALVALDQMFEARLLMDMATAPDG
jgi:hypothetical protein